MLRVSANTGATAISAAVRPALALSLRLGSAATVAPAAATAAPALATPPVDGAFSAASVAASDSCGALLAEEPPPMPKRLFKIDANTSIMLSQKPFLGVPPLSGAPVSASGTGKPTALAAPRAASPAHSLVVSLSDWIGCFIQPGSSQLACPYMYQLSCYKNVEFYKCEYKLQV